MGIYIIPSPTNFLSLSGGTVTGNTFFSNSLSATTYYSGSTSLEAIIQNLSSTYSGYNYSFSASNNLNVFTSITNSDIFVSYSLEDDINLNSFSAQTIYSGNTEIGSLFITPIQLNNAQTFVQNGLNTYTGGTSLRPTVNVSALTINTLTASGNSIVSANFSANTIFSGASNLNTLFSHVGHTHEFSNILNTAHTHSVSEISNLNSLLNTKLDLSGGTMTGGLITTSFSANTLSGGTIYSANTDLSSLFVTTGQLNNAQTFVQNGLNTYTGGTSLRPTVNVSGATLGILTVSGTSQLGVMSATTIISGSSNLNTLFSHVGHTHEFSNILNTAHTHSISDISNLSNMLSTKLNLSGGTMTGGLITTSLSATTLSGGTIYSGGTDLSSLFATSAQITNAQTFVQNGLNTYTGGTSLRPTVNVSALTINTLSASGNSIVSANLSASTIFSGASNLNTLFSNVGHTHEFSTILNTAHTHSVSDISNLTNLLNTKLNLSGGTMIGGLITTSLSATTLSGGTIYSGATDLSSLFATSAQITNAQTFVQPGTNTYTGGTSLRPTVNVSALTINTLSASGNSIVNANFSASTIFSGASNLNSLFSPTGHTHEFSTILNTAHTHSVSDVSNLTNLLNTKLNLSGGTMTGELITPSLSANTISGGTIYSGSTNLETIITSLIPSPLFSGTTPGGIKQIYPGDSNIANENYSISFGSDNKVYSKYSTILNGKTNIINSTVYNLTYNTVLGGKNQTTYNSKYSLIGAGVQNYISGYNSVILGGSGNRIYNAADHAFLLGYNNKTESTRSFIFGYTNFITGVTDSSILGGKNNKIHKNIYGTFSYNIVANSIQSTILNSDFSNIASGSGNTISSANFSSIINGQSNKTYSSFSTVVGGKLNTAKTEYSIVLGGSGNTAFGISSIILGGFNNRNTTLTSSYSTIINGVDNTISTCPDGFGTDKTTRFGTVINGFGNHVMYNYATIINGRINHINGLYNLIGNGLYNRTNISHVPQTATTVLNGIHNTAIHNYATIINGIDNFVETTFGFIGNGNFNQIPSQGYYGSILNGKRNNVQGGHFNQILNGDYSLIAGVNIRHNTIINGSGNNIPNNVSGTTILGGSFNTAKTQYGLIASGKFNTLQSGSRYNVILGGAQNIDISAIGFNTILNGLNNKINTTVSGSTILGSSNITAATSNTTYGDLMQLRSLSGVSTQMVVADVNGLLGVQTIPSAGQSTVVRDGLNTYTAGTAADYSVNISALTISTLSASGNSIVSANFSASTIFSGASNIGSLFSHVGHTHEFSTILNTAHTHSVGDVSNLTNLLNTKLDLSGGTMTGGLSAATLSAETIFSGSTNLNNLFSPTGHTHYGGIGFTIDAGTSVITTGLKGYVIIPYDAIIQSWTVVADISGSIVIDVWKDTFNNYPPLVSDSIAGTEKITLSSQTKNQDVSLSSWTTNINAGDILAFNVDSASTVHRVTVSMSVIKTN